MANPDHRPFRILIEEDEAGMLSGQAEFRFNVTGRRVGDQVELTISLPRPIGRVKYVGTYDGDVWIRGVINNSKANTFEAYKQ